MKVKELKQHIDSQLATMPRFENWEVVIPISEPSIVARASVLTTGAGFGFDWDQGKFFIQPENPLVKKKK